MVATRGDERGGQSGARKQLRHQDVTVTGSRIGNGIFHDERVGAPTGTAPRLSVPEIFLVRRGILTRTVCCCVPHMTMANAVHV